MPEDADAVLSALRLGWALAEVRGRNRPDSPQVQRYAGPRQIVDYPLPLAPQRSPAEFRIQAQVVVAAIASKLGVDGSPDKACSYPMKLDELASQLASIPENDDGTYAAWQALAELIYRFDAYIQDSLTANSHMQAAGYQLGRGLAECYWALHPDDTDSNSAHGWRFLLGGGRCVELKMLASRLSAYMAPSASAAIAGSLEVWRAVAASPAWLGGDPLNAQRQLFLQIGVWHDLVVLGQDPMARVRPYARLRSPSVIVPGIRFFAGRLILGLAGVAGLVALIITLGTGSGSTLASSLLAVLAAAGLSAGGLSAKRFAREVNNDLAAVAITTAPPPPSRNMVLQAVRQR